LEKAKRYWKKWTSLSHSAKLSFAKACFVLILVKIGLTVLPFSVFRKLFHRFSSSSESKEFSGAQIAESVWAVDTAANILPMELLCLPRALAAKYLLKKVPSITLEIGIEVNPRKGFEAHAWVEKNGQVIIGDWSDSVSYQRLWVWQ
jgi:hypothetical protein